MNLTVDAIKQVIQKKGYKWFNTELNIVGIRSSMNVPNVFNDILCVINEPANIAKFYPITTDPGLTYLVSPLNPKGCFILKPGQYIDCWKSDFHQGKPDHRALRQCGTMTGYRDGDKDNVIEMIPGTEETGSGFGVNCHGAVKDADTKTVGPWSAGCQVHSRWSNKEEMMSLVDKYKPARNRFTYTLIEEKDLL
jgi:hypothetical protein